MTTEERLLSTKWVLLSINVIVMYMCRSESGVIVLKTKFCIHQPRI